MWKRIKENVLGNWLTVGLGALLLLEWVLPEWVLPEYSEPIDRVGRGWYERIGSPS